MPDTLNIWPAGRIDLSGDPLGTVTFVSERARYRFEDVTRWPALCAGLEEDNATELEMLRAKIDDLEDELFDVEAKRDEAEKKLAKAEKRIAELEAALAAREAAE